MKRFIIFILGILYSLNVLADFEDNCITQGKRYCDQKLIQCFNKSECKKGGCQFCFDNQHDCQNILYEECNLNDKQKECLVRNDNVCEIKLIHKIENCTDPSHLSSCITQTLKQCNAWKNCLL